MIISRELDTRGMTCPLPILKTKKMMTELGSGELLKVLSSDPGSVKDMEAFCRQTGTELVESQQGGEAYSFILRKV